MQSFLKWLKKKDDLLEENLLFTFVIAHKAGKTQPLLKLPKEIFLNLPLADLQKQPPRGVL